MHLTERNFNLIKIEDIENRIQNNTPGPIGKHKFFSVIIPICRCGDELSLMFEVRAGELRSQPGDICFPGGKIEEGETPLESALREFAEETGIDASHVEVIGQFDTLYGFADYTLYTFAAKLDEEALAKLAPNTAEVAEVFTVPVQFFEENPPKIYEADIVSKTEEFPYEEAGVPRDYKWRKSKNILPVYHFEDRVIWGMTARVVKQFADKIL